MKISQKLILAFSVLILIFLVEIILNEVIINKANQSYVTIQSKINPAINILNKYEYINKELNLLINNRLNGDNEISTINRIKGITEVELAYIKTELSLLQQGIQVDNPDRSLIENLIDKTDQLILTAINFNNLLKDKNDYSANLEKAKTLYNSEFVILTSLIQNSVGYLNLNYQRAFKANNIELAENLKSVSKIILITGILGILLALIITVQITYSISKPIYKLKRAALKMSKGNLDEQIVIKGKDELAKLGQSFNAMSTALKKSFTEQEKQIDQIKSINTELEQFVYVASHDLQEPLRTMSSYIGLISELYVSQLDANALKYMTHVEEAALRMKTLIKDLLDYSRLGKEKEITNVDINQLVKNILLDFELIIKDNKASIALDNFPVIRGLEVELKQLFQNLINNGLKFRKEDTAPLIEIKVEDQATHWLFSVKDNGIGMDRKYFERVFIIFQRLHNKDDYKGTGIGLSVCKKIIEMHQGEIWIESELNKGCTFYFTIFKKLKNI